MSDDHGVVGRVPVGAFVRTMLVEFDPGRRAWLERLLRRHGHHVTSVTADQVREHPADVDLILVDIADDDTDLRTCELVNSIGNPAVIAVSGVDTEAERLRILRAGCDDHLHRGCGPIELMARIDAALRWVSSATQQIPLVRHGPLRIDTGNREVRLDDRPVHLTRKEYDLLHLLASRNGMVVDRVEILDTVWHQHSAIVSRTLDTHVSSIRRKIGRWACVTVKGYGLRIGTPEEAARLA
jgi:DNA-binding response OmpR family regulator